MSDQTSSTKDRVVNYVKNHKTQFGFAAGYVVGAVVSAIATGYFVQNETLKLLIKHDMLKD